MLSDNKITQFKNRAVQLIPFFYQGTHLEDDKKVIKFGCRSMHYKGNGAYIP